MCPEGHLQSGTCEHARPELLQLSIPCKCFTRMQCSSKVSCTKLMWMCRDAPQAKLVHRKSHNAGMILSSTGLGVFLVFTHASNSQTHLEISNDDEGCVGGDSI